MKKSVPTFLLMYSILSSYFYLIPMLFPMNDILRFFHLLSFIGVALLASKICLKKGLEAYGLIISKGWKRKLCVGFLFGFLAWTVLFLLYILFGRYEVTGVNDFGKSAMAVLVVLVGFGLGSIMNDMIVRGLVFANFRDKVPFRYLLTIALILYALDDAWIEGFSLNNTIFSLALGLSLTYAFFKTGSIWANTGIHFGINVVYGLFFGVSGNAGDGVFLFDISKEVKLFVPWLSTVVALVLFAFVYKYYGNNTPLIKSSNMKA